MAENNRPSFADVFGGRSAIPKALQASSDTLDEILGSTTDQFSGLKGPLDALRAAVAANIRMVQQQVKTGERSGKAATASMKTMRNIVAELEASMTKVTENNIIGAEEIAKMTEAVNESIVATEEHSEALGDDVDVLEERIKVEEDLIESERDRLKGLKLLEEQNERRLARVTKLNEGLERFSGSLESGTFDIDGMRRSMTSATLVWAKEKAFAARGKTGIRGGRSQLAGLVTGGLAAASGAALLANIDRERKNLNIMSKRVFQYGIGGKGLTKEGGQVALENEGMVVADAIDRVRESARTYGQDMDSAVSSFGELAGQTGMLWADSADTIDMLAGMSSMGLGDLGELTRQATKMVNSLNITGPKAALILQDVATEAVALNEEIGGKMGSVIQMDDFFAATGRLAEGVDALAVNHRGLAKAMRMSLKLGADSIKAYDRRAKAAENLTKALSSGTDEGFRTMYAQRELSILLKSKQYGAEAKGIQKMLDNKVIHLGQAAEMIQNLTGGTDPGIIADRMERAVEALDKGGLALVEAQFGKQGLDEVKLLTAASKAKKEGKSVKQFMADDTKVKKKAREQLKTTRDKVAERRNVGAKNIASATLDEFMAALRPTMKGALTAALSGVKTASAAAKAVSDMETPEERALVKAQNLRDNLKGQQLLSTRISSLVDGQVDAKEALRLLMTDKNLQAKYGKKFKGKAFIGEEGSLIRNAIQDRLSNRLFSGDGSKEVLKLVQDVNVSTKQMLNGNVIVTGANTAAEKAEATRAGGKRTRGRRGALGK